MKIDFTDEMLREAVVRADIRELEAMPADHEIEHEFSKRFERRMRKLIRRGKTGSPAGGAIVFCVGGRSPLLLQSLSCLRPR
jgi:hypothetical protein